MNREQIHAELTLELARAKKKLEQINAALAHNSVLLGLGVEKHDSIFTHRKTAPKTALEYLELIEAEEDLSDYIGREGDESTRPRLGKTAPEEIRPQAEPLISPQIHTLAMIHPDDTIGLGQQNTPQNPSKDLGNAATQDNTQDILEADALQKTLQPARQEPLAQTTAKLKNILDTLPVANANLAHQGQGADSLAFTKYKHLQTTEHHASFFWENTDNLFWHWDIKANIVYVSTSFDQYADFERQSTSTPLQDLLNILHTKEKYVLPDTFASMLLAQKASFTTSVFIKNTAAQEKTGILHAKCSFNTNGVPVQLSAIISHLADTHQAQVGSEEKFRALADISLDVIGRLDTQGTILYVSPSISKYFPVKHEDIIGKNVSALQTSGEIEQLHSTFLNVLEVGLPSQIECVLISPILGERVTECAFWPEFGESGEVVSVSLQMRDMTSAKKAIENYQALFTSMADSFILLEYIGDRQAEDFAAHDFVIVASNPAFARLMQLGDADIIGYRLDAILQEDAILFAEQALTPVLQNGQPKSSAFQCTKPSLFVEVSSYSPEHGRVACIIKDVTSMHNILQEVRLNEARFAALYQLSHMDATPDQEIIQYALDQVVRLTESDMGFIHILQSEHIEKAHTYWSQGVRTVYGENLPDAPDILQYKKAEHYKPPFSAKIHNAGTEKITFAQNLVANRYILSPVVEDGRVVCIVGVANKTLPYSKADLRQLEIFITGAWFQLRRRWVVQDLQHAKEEAEAANRAKNEFLANVSHELRTPLNGILGMLQLLQQSSLTSEQLDYVVTANYSGRSLLRIISDLLDFSRMEAGRFVLAPQPFDLSSTIRSTLGMFIHQAEQKKLRFTLRISNEIPKFLLGDEARVRQIIFNLVGNAFKFTEHGEVTVECSILPYCPRNGICVYMTVKDTGIGIPDDKLSCIFNAFTQVDGSQTRRYSGTGLGLSIVQILVKLMGGSIAVESDLGIGTTIHCVLPFTLAKAQEEIEEQAQIPEPSRPLNLLVAEDDPINRLTIRSLLKKLGHTVVCVNNGQEAIEALHLYNFDCLVTDIQMPIMDGVEAVKRIRNNDTDNIVASQEVRESIEKEFGKAVPQAISSDIPIIALTAHAMAGDKEHYLAMGMDYYLSKPISSKDLQNTLAKIALILQSQGKL